MISPWPWTWDVGNPSCGSAIALRDLNGAVVLDGCGESVTQEVDVRSDIDARLIAAAPELLEAVKKLACRNDCSCGWCCDAMLLVRRIEEGE